MNMKPEHRFLVYRLVAAVLAVLAAYNVVSADLVPLWMDVAGAALGVGASMLASFNVPRGDG